jgi:phosphoribosyl 1,2-cyclic phosphodiesterase
MRYGGDTSCVSVEGEDGSWLVLDAGTGIRRLGGAIPKNLRRLDLLLTHFHLDHILGLGFFDPLFRADLEVHVWGPESTTLDLRSRLSRYLSPPLFPVFVRDWKCRLELHGVTELDHFRAGSFEVDVAPICHPGSTVGYRISAGRPALAYLPDHEPALGTGRVPDDPEWTSGFQLASGVDLLIHDAQYTSEEYAERAGRGHSSIEHALQFASAVGARRLVPFHHDPDHSDEDLDAIYEKIDREALPFDIDPAREGAEFLLD